MANRKEALPTQQFVAIENIRNGTVVLKGGGLRQIVIVSGINFDLKSEDEQELIVGLYQNFFNSLDFQVELFIHSRKVNIESYLAALSARETEEQNELLKNQIVGYREFIKAFVAENAIMQKSYFVVIPYAPISVSKQGEAATGKLLGLLKAKGVQGPKRIAEPNAEASEQLTSHIDQLAKRTNQVIEGLNQVGLRAVQLNDEELVELFYNLYNPESIEKKVGAEAQKEQP